MERGPLSLVRIIEELLGNSGSGLEYRINDCRDLLRDHANTIYPQKSALISLAVAVAV
jgi:hypothetical protein